MNKKGIEKVKKLMKKEGFYVALFICLCIVATLGTLSYKVLLKKNLVNIPNSQKKQVSLNIDNTKNKQTASNEMQNAERVKNNDKLNDKIKITNNKLNEKTVATATATITKFINPVEGIESRTYSYPNPVKVEDNLFRSIRGINIESKLGTDVKAAGEGIVNVAQNVGVEEGVVVEIKHPNGLRTRYTNLDENILVKKGDKVNSGTIIGKVGSTAKVFDAKVFGQFLNLQVIDANGSQVNPEKYFSFSTK